MTWGEVEGTPVVLDSQRRFRVKYFIVGVLNTSDARNLKKRPTCRRYATRTGKKEKKNPNSAETKV